MSDVLVGLSMTNKGKNTTVSVHPDVLGWLTGPAQERYEEFYHAFTLMCSQRRRYVDERDIVKAWDQLIQCGRAAYTRFLEQAEAMERRHAKRVARRLHLWKIRPRLMRQKIH